MVRVNALADATVDTLVRVYSFDAAAAREAVAAVADPSDVLACVNFLLDAGEPDRGGPVVPTSLCPHAHAAAVEPSAVAAAALARRCAPGAARCAACGAGDELWLCLACGAALCGRYAAGHGLEHWRET